MKKYKILIVLLFMIFHLYGEKLKFSIQYLGISVANVQFLYNNHSLQVEATSSGITKFLADKLDNHYQIEFEDNCLPSVYKKIINQDKYKENSVTKYHRSDKNAVYFDSLTQYSNQFLIENETRDFFSALSYLRKTDLNNKGNISIDSNQILWKAQYHKIGIEENSSIFGKIKTAKVQIKFIRIDHKKKKKSDLLTNNLVNEKNVLFFWFTDDDKQIPIKAEYVTFPFSVTWVLTDYEK